MGRIDARFGDRRGWGATVIRERRRLRPELVSLERRELLATFTVTNVNDSGPGSLRDAIAQLNATTGNNTIQFSSLFNAPQTITLTSGQLTVTNATGTTTIQGPGADLLTIDGNHASRVLQFNASTTVSLSDLTVSGGSIGNNGVGGGVAITGSVTTMVRCVVTGNASGFFGGGGVGVSGSGNSSSTLIPGNLTMTDCTISNNKCSSALSGGAGISAQDGTLVLNNCVVTGNTAYGDGGAGLSLFDNTTTITNTTFSNNRVQELQTSFGFLLGYGGGMTAHGSTLTMSGSTFSGNSASGGAGIDFEGGTSTLTNCTLAGNTCVSAGSGGGFYATNFASISLISCTISRNSAYSGGGMFLDLAACSLTNSIIAGATSGGDIASNNGIAASGTYNIVGTGPLTGSTNTTVSDPLLAPLGDYGGPTQTLALLPGSPAISHGNGALAQTLDQRGFVRGNFVDAGAVNGQLITVTSAADDGSAGTLRTAINAMNNQGESSVITFSSLFNSPQTIRLLLGQLQVVSPGVILRGPGANLLSIDGNQTFRVFSFNGGTGTVSGVTFKNARTGNFGAGVFNQGTLTLSDCAVAGNTSTSDGGGIYNIGTLNLLDTTISGNTAVNGGGLFDGAGGLATLTNVTIAGNSANRGGGIANASTGASLLRSVTISGNVAPTGGGLANINLSNTADLRSSVVSGNTTASGGSVASDVSGTGVSGSYSVIGTGSISGSHNLTGVTAPLFSALGSYGGTTQTLAILPGSPLIGLGDPSLAGDADQRGFVRGTSIDPGAYQDQGFTLTPSVLSTPQTTTRGSSFARPLTVFVTANNAGGFTNPIIGGVVTFAAPTSGATATLSATTVTIASGQVAVTAVANTIGGTFTVTASASGAAAPAQFALSIVEASSLVVTTTQDLVNNVDGLTSLREALTYADSLVTSATITFDPTVFPSTPGSLPRTITLAGTQLLLRSNRNPITVQAPSVGLTIDAAGKSRVLTLQNFLTVNLANLTLTGGNTVLDGGAISSSASTLTLTNCTLANNTAGAGGGGAITNGGGRVTLTDCSILNNTSALGGGLLNLINLNTPETTMILVRCTVSGNTALPDIYGDPGLGGGILTTPDSILTLTDCTIVGNSAASQGGGIYSDRSTVTMTNNTVAQNTGGGTGGLFNSGGSLTITSSIVAGNSTATAGNPPSDIFTQNGTVVSGSYNIIGTGGSGGLFDQVNHNQVGVANVRLGSLGNYGGRSQTLPVLPGSPAIGKGDPARAGTTDERGYTRGASVDVGAYQSQGFTLATVAGSTPQSAPATGTFANPLAVVVSANNTAQFTNPVDGGVISFTVNPVGGASATLSAGSATIAAGRASVTATAGSTVGGPYTVTASAPGVATPAGFSLTNLTPLQPVFSSLASPVITYGTATAILSGTVAAGIAIPTGSVSVTLDGVTLPATIGPGGAFSALFDTHALVVSGSPYSVSFSLAAGGGFAAANGSSSVTVNRAHLSVAADPKSMDTGATPPTLTATISGFVNGEGIGVVSGSPALSTTATGTSPAGLYPITVGVGTLSAANYDFTSFTGSTLTVAARPLSVLTPGLVNAYQGMATGAVTLATFGDPDAVSQPTTYTAQVDWLGNGTWQAATVTLAGTTLTVSGGFTYAASGVYHPAVRLTDAGGTQVSTTATVNVATDVSAQVLAVRSGLVLNRTTGLFTGSITLTNTGTTALGPLTLMMVGLPAGVTLDAPSGTTADGTPYLSLGGLAVGQSITIKVAFRKTSPTLAVTYTPLVYAMPS